MVGSAVQTLNISVAEARTSREVGIQLLSGKPKRLLRCFAAAAAAEDADADAADFPSLLVPSEPTGAQGAAGSDPEAGERNKRVCVFNVKRVVGRRQPLLC